MKDDLTYTSSSCLEPFPFPDERFNLEAVGRHYYDLRFETMRGNGEGLTDLYNRFHNPNERAPEITKLRELHAAMVH